MIRIGYDSNDIGAIPADADVAFLYADQVSTIDELRRYEARWPQVVLIDRGLGDPLGEATAIDVERGAHTIADAPGWWDRQHRLGREWLMGYVNRSNLIALTEAMGNRNWWRWIATLDGTMTVAGHPLAAVQFAGASAAGEVGTGMHADATIIVNDGWRPASAWIAQAEGVAHQLAGVAQSAAAGAGQLAAMLSAHK